MLCEFTLFLHNLKDEGLRLLLIILITSDSVLPVFFSISSNVIYVGATPYCKKNIDYIKKQSKKFIEGKSPPDFAAEDYEINYKVRTKINDLSELAKKQLGLIDWN